MQGNGEKNVEFWTAIQKKGVTFRIRSGNSEFGARNFGKSGNFPAPTQNPDAKICILFISREIRICFLDSVPGGGVCGSRVVAYMDPPGTLPPPGTEFGEFFRIPGTVASPPPSSLCRAQAMSDSAIFV